MNNLTIPADIPLMNMPQVLQQRYRWIEVTDAFSREAGAPCTYYVPTKATCASPGDFPLCDLLEGEWAHRGMDDATLKLELQDGTTRAVEGPWHSNSDSLYNDTKGRADLREQHLTYVILALDRDETEMIDVVYADTEPVVGPWDRGAMLANAKAKALRTGIYYVTRTQQGIIGEYVTSK